MFSHVWGNGNLTEKLAIFLKRLYLLLLLYKLVRQAQDVGKIGVYTDASAAIGIAQRKGSGKVRHIDVGMLWIQQNCRNGTVDVKKVAGKSNPADIFTKAVPAEVMWGHMRSIGFESREGRSEVAVELVKN